MSLPPEHITIKRRRDEQPVDSLYIQKEQQHKKRRFTDFVFKRIREDEAQNHGSSAQASFSCETKRQTQRAVSGYSLPQVPTVRASLAGEEYQAKQHTSSSSRAVQKVPDPLLVQQTSMSDDTLLAPSTPTAEPRRFHLTKSASSLSLRHHTPSSGIQKHKKSRRNDLAVFVEQGKDKLRPKTSRRNPAVASQRQSQIIGDSMPASAVVQAEEDKTRKRPNASAAEREWRAKNWGVNTSTTAPRQLPVREGRTIHDPSNKWDYSSIELAEQLQQVAFLESGYTNGTSVATGNVLSSPNAKIKPKAHPARFRDRQTHPSENVGNEMEAEDDVEDDTEYVYDTFVRQTGPSSRVAPTSSTDPLQGLDLGNVGIMVILEADEELWETYGEDDDSDRDWNSEEEDENGTLYSEAPEQAVQSWLTWAAEDYYANDYPEDEVTSDDERGIGAYGHRRGASDDEEFDEGTVSWSDDDDARYPWKRNVRDSGVNSLRESNDQEAS